MFERPQPIPAGFAEPLRLESSTRGRAAGDRTDDLALDFEDEPVRRAPLDLDRRNAAAVPVDVYRAEVATSAAATMAMLAEHRSVRPMRVRDGREARILACADAALATGPNALADVVAWWQTERGDGSHSSIWPVAFLLALTDGSRGLVVLEEILESLRDDELGAIHIAADALVATNRPELHLFGADLAESPNPLARAIGIEVLSRLGNDGPDRFTRALDDPSAAVVQAGIRALVRSPEGSSRALMRVDALLSHADTDVRWEAARATIRWGSWNALSQLREGHDFGSRAPELLVCSGNAGDIAHLERLVTRSPVGAVALDRIARFGHAQAWSFLLHFLADDQLAAAAASALVTLFGEAVQGKERKKPAAWRAWLSDADLDPASRYRNGEPWTPAVVTHECMAGDLSRLAVEARLDELAGRTRVPIHVDLARWNAESRPELGAALASASGARWSPGAWEGR